MDPLPNFAPSREPSFWTAFVRDVSYNLAGQLVPLLAGLITVPILLRTLGIERVGVLAIAWLFVGYSGLLDLGLGRSITQVAAEGLGSDRRHAMAPLLWTALIFCGVLSVAGTALAFGLIGPLLHSLNLSAGLQEEVRLSLRIFCLSIPPAILGAILMGFLTAYRAFGLINAIKIPTGVLLVAGPLLSISFGSHSLVPVMAILVAARWLVFLLFLWAASRVEPSVRSQLRFDAGLLRPLLRLGSWITVTNVISPVLVYCDRFVIGSVLSVATVAYYTTPQDAITKLLALPVATVTVLFPYLAAHHQSSPVQCLVRSREILVQIFLLLFPLIALIVIFSRQGMTLWLGPEFAARSYQLLQVLTLGILINGLAQVPATILQGIGKPYWPAIIHLIELLLYVPGLYFAVHHFGLAGAALSWVGRITFDAIALAWAVKKIWGQISLVPFADLLPQLLLTGLLGLYVAWGDERQAFPFALLLSATFLILFRERLSALAKNGRNRILVRNS